MRKIKKIFKFLSYSLLFLFITLGSAYGVINISLNNAANKDKLAGSAESNIPEEITCMINEIMQSPYLTTQMQVEISSPSQNIELDMNDVVVDLSSGLDKLTISAGICVEVNDSTVDISVQYAGGEIFIDGFNNKFKLETGNLLSSITELTSLLNIEMPNLGGFDMGALDINAVLGMLKISNKTQTEDSIFLTIEIPAIEGVIELECDKDYKLESLNIDSLSFNDMTISVNGGFSYPEEVVVEEIIKEEFVNLTSVISYTKNLTTLITNDSMAFDFELQHLGQNYTGELLFDIQSLNFMAGVQIGNLKANIYLIDNIFYLDLGNLCAKFDINNLSQLQPIFDELGIDISLQNIMQIIEDAKTSGIGSLTSLLNNSAMNLNELDLSILGNVNEKDKNLSICLNNIGVLTLNSNENGLESVELDGIVKLKLNVKQPRKFNKPANTDDFIDLENFIPLTQKLASLIKDGYVYGNINLDVSGLKLSIDYQLSLKPTLSAKITFQIFDKDVEIIIKDGIIYASFLNIHAKFDMANTDEILSQISKDLDLELGDAFFEIFDLLSKVFDKTETPHFIRSLSEENGNIEITLYNNTKVLLNIEENRVVFDINYNKFNVNLTAQSSTSFVLNVNENSYVDISKFLPFLAILGKNVSQGDIYAQYSFNTNDISLDGGFNFEDEKLFFISKINFKGINAVAGLSDGKIYFNIGKIFLSFDLNNYSKIKQLLSNSFGIELDDIDNLLKDNVGISIDQILDFAKGNGIPSIEGLSFNADNLSSMLDKLQLSLTASNLTVNYDNKLTAQLSVEDDNTRSINLNSSDFNGCVTLLKSQYVYNLGKKYVEVSPIIDLVNNFIENISNKKLAIETSISSNENSFVTANLQIDNSKQLKMSGQIVSNIKFNLNSSFNVSGDETYININGILLKIKNSAIKEIVSTASEVFGFKLDSFNSIQSLNFDEIFEKLSINSEDNISKVLSMVKLIEKKYNNYVITLNLSSLLKNDNANNVVITIVTNGKNISGVTFENLYTPLSLTEKFEGSINFNFEPKIALLNKGLHYVDITSAKEILKAALNMSKDKGFVIKGALEVEAELINIPISKSINFEVRINVNSQGKIEAYGTFGPIPTLVFVNNDVPYKFGDTNSGSNRYLNFYYKDGCVYLYRSEKVYVGFFGSRTYEKCVKVSLSTLINNPLKFLKYVTGFTEPIMDEIREAIEKSRRSTKKVDPANYIKSFSQNSNIFTIKLDMAEITKNDDLDTMTLLLKTSNDGNNKTYISNLGMSLNMPLSSAFKMTLSTSGVTVTKSSNNLDMSALTKFINNYRFAEGEYWEASDGSWSKVTETNATLSFVTNSHHTVDNITGKSGSSLTLPVLNSHIKKNGDTITYRTFEGWYVDKELKYKFEDTKMPGFNLTLYAKWSEKVEQIIHYDDLII